MDPIITAITLKNAGIKQYHQALLCLPVAYRNYSKTIYSQGWLPSEEHHLFGCVVQRTPEIHSNDDGDTLKFVIRCGDFKVLCTLNKYVRGPMSKISIGQRLCLYGEIRTKSVKGDIQHFLINPEIVEPALIDRLIPVYPGSMTKRLA